MKKESREELDAYFAEANSWAQDERENLKISRKVAWIVASVAIAIAFFEAIALIVLTPLKTVEPYTLMVDKQTGFVQELKPIDPQLVSGDEALTQSFLVQYVIAREGFDVNALQSDYRKVSLWSTGAARSSYLATVPASNPSSYLATLPRSTIMDVRVKSVSSIGDKTAMVRFETSRKDAGGKPSASRAWVSVVRYQYSGEPMAIEDRFVNPLGFQVVQYRRSEEALPEPSMTIPAAAISNIPESSDISEGQAEVDTPSLTDGRTQRVDRQR